MNKITEILWYDPKSDSTLHRYDWRFKHNGIALLLMFALTFVGLSALISAIVIHSVFTVYKLFIQGNIKTKTIADFKDFFSDFIDYSVVWLLVFTKSVTLVILGIIIICYLFTSIKGWSKP